MILPSCSYIFSGKNDEKWKTSRRACSEKKSECIHKLPSTERISVVIKEKCVYRGLYYRYNRRCLVVLIRHGRALQAANWSAKPFPVVFCLSAYNRDLSGSCTVLGFSIANAQAPLY